MPNKNIAKIHALLKKRLQEKSERIFTKKILQLGYDNDSNKRYITTRGQSKNRSSYFKYDMRTFLKQNEIRVNDIINNKLKSHSCVSILDVGAGEGNFLSDLKQKYKEKLYTHALILGSFSELEQKQKSGSIDKITKRSVENFIPETKYDLIFSYFGGIDYTAHPDIAIAKLAYSLSPKGMLFISGEDMISDFTIKDMTKYISKDPIFIVKRIAHGIIIYRRAVK